ncbi:MAG: hypothetical protein GY855_16630, partial [candidate division Zixibacteria bacterium]|nr:hypothetical protein [candidate division Zixibacteria bacterium]
MKSIPIFVILLSLLNIVHAEKRNIEFGDLYSYPVVGNMQLSPDGKMIV